MRAVTRKEKIWKAMMNDDPSAMANPVTREEKKLAKLAKAACENDLFCDGPDAADMLRGMIDGSITEINSPATSIRERVFSSCESLTSASFPKATSAGTSAFEKCTSLTSVYFPLLADISQNMFNGCTALPSVSFPQATSIKTAAFAGCTALKDAHFPNVTEVGTSAFSGATFTDVSFPKLTEIAFNMFFNISTLVKASFPEATSVAGNAFMRCTALTALVLGNTENVATLGSNVFADTPIASGTGYIYVPAALIDSYKAATNWRTYAAQFRALEDYTVDGTITGELDESKI